MKKTCWIINCAFLSTAILAQQASNPPSPTAIETPAATAALTNTASSTNTTSTTPKKKGTKRKTVSAAAKKKEELSTVPLVAGPAIVVASNVNVRGQAGLKGEVITRVTKGQSLTVLEEITLKKSAPDEPSAWAKIAFPTNGHVWVNGSFIETSNKTVIPKKLNVRGGPGENFSVVGTMKRGDAVTELGAKGEWLEIEPPPDSYAFVAAQYLKQEPPTPTPTTLAETAPAPIPVAETAPVPTPTDLPATNSPPAEPTNAAPVEPVSTQTTAPVEEPPPKRIVQREGIVRGTFSIQAPTQFELISPDNRRTINYLYTTAHDLDLSRYKGMRIIVTGEEALDERWRNTPVLTIQRIQVVE